MPHTTSAKRQTGAGSSASPPRVMLVVNDPKRHALLHRCVQNNLPGCRIDVVESYFDAMDHSIRMDAHLLVLDLSMDRVLVPALKRFLARAAPQTLIHVFDDSLDNALTAGIDCNRPSVVRLKQSFSALTSGHIPLD